MKILMGLGVALLASSSRAAGQVDRPVWPLPIDAASATTGSSDEESLLLLQLAGRAPLIQTTIRSFSSRELDTLVSFERPRPSVPLWDDHRFTFSRPSVSVSLNSELPYTENEGVVWEGRGITVVGTAGGVGRLGPFSFAFRPVAFWTQNLSVPRPVGPGIDSTGFANPYYPELIDLPFRFGNGPYGRIDPGESWAQLDTRFVAAGISTATQQWGPMHVYPLLLGPNAGGFPHVFAGTGLPWNIGIGKLSGRMALGMLDRSAFAPSRPGDPRRLASEIVGVFTPAGLDGLEIGGGRFFHRVWPENGIGLSDLKIPFEGFLKQDLPSNVDSLPENQLADAFFRLARPQNGIEIYGEFLRDDNSANLSDLIGEPDHESAYGLGIRRVWTAKSSTDGALTALTLEVANGRISHLARLRGETAMYVHTQVVEGHTEDGKLLGSPAVFGGGGYCMVLERRRTTGGWQMTLESHNVAQSTLVEGGDWAGSPAGVSTIGLTRIFETHAAEYSIGGTTQVAWNRMSGLSNVGVSFTVRPRTDR